MTEASKQAERAKPESCIVRVLRFLGRLWDVIQDIGRVLKAVRFSLLITLLVGFALIFAGQGQDLIIIHAEQPGTLPFFYLAVLFWALNAWYWARSILRHIKIPYADDGASPWFGGRSNRVLKLVEHLPRVIGAGAFVLVAAAQFKAAIRDGVGEMDKWVLICLGAFSILLCVVFYYIAFNRRQWLGAEETIPGEVRKEEDKSWRRFVFTDKKIRYVEVESLSDVPDVVKFYSKLCIVILTLLFLLVLFNSDALSWFSSSVVFLVVGSLWIAPGSWLLFLSKRGDLPILTLFLLIALVFSIWNDNHDVRSLEPGRMVQAGERWGLEDARAGWLSAQPAAGPDRRPTLVIVATAGGGSRAAYWTASVLGTIQDLHPGFDEQLFGISGVSGGSVGAVVYRALLTTLPAAETGCAERNEDRYVYRSCAEEVLGQDFLTSTVSAALLPDLVQRLSPWDLFPDRAKALEEAWEAAWSDAIEADSHRDLLAGDFLAAWPDRHTGPEHGGLPALFLNGTSVSTGKRIVTSNLDLSYGLTDAFDLFTHWPAAIRMSTAANNSARFPYIGPAGTLHPDPQSEEPVFTDRIVDGGYFENFGAATALDLLKALTIHRCGETAESCDYDVVVIQISSDPDYRGIIPHRGSTPHGGDAPASFAAEVSSPVSTLLHTRGARGILAAQRLHDWTLEQIPGTARHFEFRLVIPEGTTVPSLGWTLSDSAFKAMNCQFLQDDNQRQLRELGIQLGFDPSQFLDYLLRREECA